MARAVVDTGTDEQHSVARSVTLHLLPGALITVFYALIAPLVRSFGLPSLMAIFLTILIVLLPMVYAVWWKRDIRIGIAVHVLGNLFSMLALLPVLFG